MKKVGQTSEDTVMSDRHRQVFGITFQVSLFTKHVKNRKTLRNLLKKMTLGKLENFDLDRAVGGLETHPSRSVGIVVYSADYTSDIKKMTKIANELNDSDFIELDRATHTELYGGHAVEDGSIKIRF